MKPMKLDEFNPQPREHAPGEDAPKAAVPRDYAQNEFAANGGEFSQPGPEFRDRAPVFPKRAPKKSVLFVAASMLLLVVSPLLEPVKQLSGILPGTEPAAPLPASVTAEPESTPAPDVAPAFEVSESAENGEPVPEAVLPPSCEPIFIAFSDELHGKLTFTNPEAILSVRAELWDSLGGTPEQSWDVPRENVLDGEYELPDMMGIFDMYMAHHEAFDPGDAFPVPELRVATVYLDGDREASAQQVLPVSEELGWSIRDQGDQIVFRTYESEQPARITVRNGVVENALESLSGGDFLISVEMDGSPVNEASCTVETETETWKNSENEDITFYYASLHVPKRTGSRAAVITVYQKLTGYDTVWSRTVELKY